MSNPNDPKPMPPDQPDPTKDLPKSPPTPTPSKGSFEFQLPPLEEGAIAPPPVPQSDPSVPELPPYPVRPVPKTGSRAGTFEFELPDVEDEPDPLIETTPTVNIKPLSSDEVSFQPPATGDPAALSFGGKLPELSGKSSTDMLPDIPPLEPASGVDQAAEILDKTDLTEPVAPAAGWLDSDPGSLPTVGKPAATVEGMGELTESSDIFNNEPIAPALPVDEASDIISATSSPSDERQSWEQPNRPSDVALTFDSPPGGSTMQEADSGNLPLAEELTDSSDSLFDEPAPDHESIHDLENLGAGTMFDSAQLAEA
ncbi:MAG: hypothetical protein L0241_16080, partial [Planctomycetia bacterium]|nr:hypothetical protein [Planctomycetia bacterium]